MLAGEIVRKVGLRPPRISIAGDAALLVELGDEIDPRTNWKVHVLDRALAREPCSGLVETIPAYSSLLVLIDPLSASLIDVRRELEKLASRVATPSTAEPGPLKSVPTLYDGEDLEWVAAEHGLSRDHVIRLHSEREYRVYMLGFSPGFPYMGLLTEALDTPRRATPRVRVPAGSVAIAGRQTAIYPSSTPGGWHLIGRSSLRLFDPRREPPSFLSPGDRVRFVPVDALPAPEPLRPADVPAGEPLAEVLDGGFLTTVQDLGRVGFQRLGVPVAGAVDPISHRAANFLVGNDPGAAGLECTVNGPALSFLSAAVVAVTGADLGAFVERRDLGRWPVPSWSSFRVRAGNVLHFTGRRFGARAYVAFSGGIEVPRLLGSRSTYLPAALGGHEGRALRAGDRLFSQRVDGAGLAGRRWPRELIPRLDEEEISVRVVMGPQDDHVTERARRSLFSSTYRLSPASDRMGCRLEGSTLSHKGTGEILSDGMILGAIQVPPDGCPIIMLADRATTGGYPKIGVVATADIARLAQLLPGDRIRFREVDASEARETLIQQRRSEEEAARSL